MQCVIFSSDFEPPEQLKDFLRELGYSALNPQHDFDVMFDERVVEFCKNRTTKLWGEDVYIGKETTNRKIGFHGAGYFRDIDTTRKWCITYNAVDAVVIKYIDRITNKYGYTYSLFHDE